MKIEPVACPWAHEDEIRRLTQELQEAKEEARKAQEASCYWVELQRALGGVDDLEADRAALFARAVGAESRLEATQKIIDAERARADGWRLRWEKAQEQVTRWFKASGGTGSIQP